MKLFIEDLPLSGKKVIMRVDFNVPLDADEHITDATRILAALPSINYVLEQGGALILMSHLGRPKHAPSQEFSLAPCAEALSKILKKEVKLAPDCIGFEVEEMVKNLKPKEVLLLENLRFHRAEEFPEEDPSFAQKLASYGDFYVNDAFGTAHRKHSSTYTIAQFFPGKAAAGYLLEKEIRFLGLNLSLPKRPFMALIGGAKISSKMGVLKALLQKVDALLIGGAMSNTFLKAQGKQVGDSFIEEDFVSVAREILLLAQEKKVPLYLPEDVILAEEATPEAYVETRLIEEGIPPGWQSLDIGNQTCKKYADILKKAKTILWNGPVGVYEIEAFANGSYEMAKAISESGAISIVGGGDTIAVLNEMEIADKITHISTGGGATLEYIEHGTLPGIEALSEKSVKV